MQVNRIGYYPRTYQQQNYNPSIQGLSFSANNISEDEYKKAKAYANLMKVNNFVWRPRDVKKYNLEKLDGIQKDIKIFEDMNIKEILFMFEDLFAINVQRGCPNQCLHCYAEAKPAEKDTTNSISKMPFETYKEILEGIQKLDKRLGFSPIKHNGQEYVNLFYDSDCMETALVDKSGLVHDFTELTDIFYQNTGVKTVFDTAGWNPNNKKQQEKAEKYVKYFLNNSDKFYQINLSLSPFSSIYSKALELGFNPENYNLKNQPWHPEYSEKELSKGEKLYNIYIDRCANMLMTFSPLFLFDEFNIIIRSIQDSEKALKHHSVSYFSNVIKKHILSTLNEKLILDLKNDKKYVSRRLQIGNMMYKAGMHLSYPDDNLIMGGRLKQYYKAKNPQKTDEEIADKYRQIKIQQNKFNKLKNEQIYPHGTYMKIIDTDGKLYLYDNYTLIPTELKLKLDTNDKKVPPLKPEPEDFVITKAFIDKI